MGFVISVFEVWNLFEIWSFEIWNFIFANAMIFFFIKHRDIRFTSVIILNENPKINFLISILYSETNFITKISITKCTARH